MADIFISYAKEDRSRVAPLAKALADHGWSIWWDRTIPAGKTWREVIGEALESARSVIVVWSKTSVKSRWVQEEADWGLERKILIPILLDEIRPPLGFGAVQAVSLVNWNPAQSSPEFEKLIADISIILGPSPKHAKAAKQAAEEDRKLKEAEKEAERARKAEAEVKAEEERKRKPEEEEAERARKEQVERNSEPGKSPATKIGILVIIAVVIFAGAILLFQQKPTKSRTETPVAPVQPKPPVGAKPSELSSSKKITNSIGMEFVLIPAGSFVMGSNTGDKDEIPPHKVKIPQPFYLQTTEVSQGQWKKVMGNNPSLFQGCGDDCPVEKISWNDAREFIKRLNVMENTDKYRLPTEAEWEYACRAGTTTEYSFGDDASKLGEYIWYGDNSNKATHRVATSTPNSWGLYDMHGNVLEWVEDDWHSSYEGAPNDGPAWVDNPRGSRRVMRGGAFGFFAPGCRSATRSKAEPETRLSFGGFRLAKSP